MGLDLTLYPIRYADLPWWLATESLGCERQAALFRRVEQVESDPLPKVVGKPVSFKVYKDEGIVEAKTDSYGTPLRVAKAGNLAKAALPAAEMYPWNRAAWAYLKVLPPDTPVVLYWN